MFALLSTAALPSLVALFGAAALIQPPIFRVAARASGTAPIESSRISAVRELPDGRVIVLDVAERRLDLVDFATNRAIAIRRQGPGPDEYLMPDRLLPLGAGVTGLRDGARPGLLLVSGTGAAVGTLASRGPAPRIGREVLPPPTAVAADTTGRLYAAMTLPHRLPGGRLIPTDSIVLVRWPAGGGLLDTLTFIPARLPATAVVQNGLVVSRPGPVEAFRAFVQWTVSLDGTVGVVHPEPYRIELISPALGVRRQSAPMPQAPIRVTEALKRQWRREQVAPVVQMVYPPNGAAPYVRIVRPAPREPARWPRSLPAVTGDAPMFDQQGRLWVARTTPANAPRMFDVFDRQANRVAQVRLPPASRLVGFGAGAIYLARRTADDLEYLQRHPLPTGFR